MIVTLKLLNQWSSYCLKKIARCKSRNGSNQHEATTKCWSRSCCNQAKKEEKHVLQPRLKETNKWLQPRLKWRSKLRSMKNQQITKNKLLPIPLNSLAMGTRSKKRLLQALQWVLGARERLAYELNATCDVFICLFCLLFNMHMWYANSLSRRLFVGQDDMSMYWWMAFCWSGMEENIF